MVTINVWKARREMQSAQANILYAILDLGLLYIKDLYKNSDLLEMYTGYASLL